MAIETLSKTSSDQVRKLLEDCGVKSIKERAGRFDIECPSCQKTEAFIEYRYDKRWLCCMNNRPMTKSTKMLLCSSDKLTSIIYAFSKEKTI